MASQVEFENDRKNSLKYRHFTKERERISFILNLLNKHIDFILQDGVTEEDR